MANLAFHPNGKSGTTILRRMNCGLDSPGGRLSDKASSFMSPDSRPNGEMQLAKEKKKYKKEVQLLVLFDPSFVSQMSANLWLEKLVRCLFFVCLVGGVNKSFVTCRWLLATVQWCLFFPE